jgi:hypothetical protein
LSGLKKEDGIVITDEKELGQAANGFYQHFYTLEGTSGIEEVLGSMSRKMSSEMNRKLGMPFSVAEIK